MQDTADQNRSAISNLIKNDVNTEFSGLIQNMSLDLGNNLDLNLKKEISFGTFNNNTNNNIQEINININSNLFDKDKNILENSDFNNNFNMFQPNHDQDNLSAQDSNNNNYNNSHSNNEESPEDNNGQKDGEVGKVIKISEELNKPDELGYGCTDDDYIKIINGKIQKYKRSLDNKVIQIERKKEELIKQEEKFNNFIEAINNSKKIINCINDNLNSNTRELEEI